MTNSPRYMFFVGNVFLVGFCIEKWAGRTVFLVFLEILKGNLKVNVFTRKRG